MPDPATDTPRPRLTLADAYRDAQHVIDQLTTRSTESSATVEIDTTAKGEPKPRVHLFAPVGADLQALTEHVNELARIALAGYFSATPAPVVAEDEAEDEVPF